MLVFNMYTEDFLAFDTEWVNCCEIVKHVIELMDYQ